jgi:hypothetical protein
LIFFKKGQNTKKNLEERGRFRGFHGVEQPLAGCIGGARGVTAILSFVWRLRKNGFLIGGDVGIFIFWI